MQTPFIGPSYDLESRPASVQRTINLIPVPLEPGNDRAPWVLKDVPGLTQFFPALACTTLQENFTATIPEYTVWRGDAAPFSIASGVMTIAQQTDVTPNTIIRALSSSTIAVDGFEVEFNMGTIQADDTGQIWIPSTEVSPGSAISFIPARDVVADPSRRPFISWSGSEFALGSSSLTPGVWYKITGRLIMPGWVAWELVNLSSSAITSGTGVAPLSAALASRWFGANADAPNTTGSCQYRLGRMTDCNAQTVYTAILDAATKGASISLSSNGLALTGIAPANGMAYSTTEHNAADDHCFEVIPAGTNDGRVMIGIVQVGADMSKYPGFDSLGRGYWGNTGQKYINNTPTTYGATFGVGDHIMARLNAGSLTFYKNGVSQGVAYSGLTGTWRAAIGFATSVAGTRSAIYNGGQWSFFGGTPSGSTVWG